jgi:hypothetical protein
MGLADPDPLIQLVKDHLVLRLTHGLASWLPPTMADPWCRLLRHTLRAWALGRNLPCRGRSWRAECGMSPPLGRLPSAPYWA